MESLLFVKLQQFHIHDLFTFLSWGHFPHHFTTAESWWTPLFLKFKSWQTGSFFVGNVNLGFKAPSALRLEGLWSYCPTNVEVSRIRVLRQRATCLLSYWRSWHNKDWALWSLFGVANLPAQSIQLVKYPDSSWNWHIRRLDRGYDNATSPTHPFPPSQLCLSCHTLPLYKENKYCDK